MTTESSEMPDFWDVTQLLILNHGAWITCWGQFCLQPIWTTQDTRMRRSLGGSLCHLSWAGGTIYLPCSQPVDSDNNRMESSVLAATYL